MKLTKSQLINIIKEEFQGLKTEMEIDRGSTDMDLEKARATDKANRAWVKLGQELLQKSPQYKAFVSAMSLISREAGRRDKVAKIFIDNVEGAEPKEDLPKLVKALNTSGDWSKGQSGGYSLEEAFLKEHSASSDQWTDAILDWIYSQLPEGGLEEATPAIVAALQEVIQTLESPEANPVGGGMYGEEPY